jgi:pyruvate/2-oxoacid:ferredoxin oxidoreductase beta subunit
MPKGEASVATRRTTRVFIETHECWVVRRPEQLRRAWCAGCGEEAVQLAAEQAARAAGTTLRALCRLVEAGLLHSTETADGSLLVCVNSLMEQTSKGD